MKSLARSDARRERRALAAAGANLRPELVFLFLKTQDVEVPSQNEQVHALPR